jgi:hypothetical protein
MLDRMPIQEAYKARDDAGPVSQAPHLSIREDERPAQDADPVHMLTRGDPEKPLFAQVAVFVRLALMSNMAHGARLPTERALAVMLRVSRITVRRALEALETDGLVDRRVGSGTYCVRH